MASHADEVILGKEAAVLPEIGVLSVTKIKAPE